MAVGTESERAETVTVDKHTEQLDRIAKLTFGPEAHLGGDFDGELRILVSGSVLGTGDTFAGALSDAQHTAQRELRRQADTLVVTGSDAF